MADAASIKSMLVNLLLFKGSGEEPSTIISNNNKLSRLILFLLYYLLVGFFCKYSLCLLKFLRGLFFPLKKITIIPFLFYTHWQAFPLLQENHDNMGFQMTWAIWRFGWHFWADWYVTGELYTHTLSRVQFYKKNKYLY